ncbi:MAG: rhodanese-like domain-containing protein [Ilumatobacteraceae bacterium]
MSTLTPTTRTEQAAAAVTSLTPVQFATEADDAHTVVVDLREVDERVAHGSIAHSVHVPRGVLEFRADPTHVGHDPRLRPDQRVLLYCADGARSVLAEASLRPLGYHDVAHLHGGLVAWSAAQLPLVGRMRSPY